jgi:hypothetical protein
MIDTIRLKVPSSYTIALDQIFNQYSSHLCKYDNLGCVQWERNKIDSLPSSYSNIFVTKLSDCYFIEFSLAKQILYHQCGVLYNHINYDIDFDLDFLCDWWSVFCVRVLHLSIPLDDIIFNRIDLGVNFILENSDLVSFFHDACVQLSRLQNKRVHHYDSTIYYPSGYLTKKIYSKYADLLHLHKKHKINRNSVFNLFNTEQQFLDFQNMIRFEFEHKAKYLRYHNVNTLHDIRLLSNNFEDEVMKFVNSFSRVSLLSESSLPPELYQLLMFVRQYGYRSGINQYMNKNSRATYYRNKKRLYLDYGIDIRAVTLYPVVDSEDSVYRFRRAS